MHNKTKIKIRSGFISNSSSSSFVVYGIGLNDNEFFSICQEHFSEEVIERIKEEPYEVQELSQLKDKFGLEFIHDWECEYHLIGRQFKMIGDNETGLQFKNDVTEKLKSVVQNKSPRIIEVEINS